MPTISPSASSIVERPSAWRITSAGFLPWPSKLNWPWARPVIHRGSPKAARKGEIFTFA